MKKGARRLALVKRARELPDCRQMPPDRNRPQEMIGRSAAMQGIVELVDRLAPSRATVLIQGESGTGKELVARALHGRGPRRPHAFVALNMAAIPHRSIESELFGHERGAFIDAHCRRPGRFEQTDGGTLFLDEIGDMPLDLQTRLLRVLEDGEFFPVGAQHPIRSDARVVAATRHDLEKLVAEGRFREDLFHRLNVICIRLPPLRERREDIPLLLRHFLETAADAANDEVKTLHPEAEAYLCRLDWPGNVRELKNACLRMSLTVPGADIGLDDLSSILVSLPTPPPPSIENWQAPFRRWVDQRLRLGDGNVAWEAIRHAEKILIDAALEVTCGRKQDAAKLLGYGRNTLSRKIADLDEGKPEAEWSPQAE